jgi:hypothetical protein
MSRLENSMDVVSMEELLFPVEMIDNPNLSNSEYSKIVVGKFGEDVKHLNYCSNRYELVPNGDIFPNIENVLKINNIAFKAKYYSREDVRFYCDIQITDERFEYKMKGTNDVITPMLRVQHSYNGLTKYRIVFGYFRFVCTNGLTIPVKEMADYNLSISGKHTSIIVQSIQKLNEMLINFASNASDVLNAITAKYECLGGKVVTKIEDRILEVLKAGGINAVDNKSINTVNNIYSRVMAEANNDSLGYNGMVNDWLIYNGVNQYINDNSLNIALPEKRMETDSKILEYMLETV